MEIARKAGIGIVFGIPAIVSSGLVWQIAENWYVVFGYLGLLLLGLAGFLITR